MVIPIVLKSKKSRVKTKKVAIDLTEKKCCLCFKSLSIYNKNKYELCHMCLTKVQQSVNDIPDSKFAEVLLQMRSDMHDRSKSNKRPNLVKENMHVDNII